MVQRLILILMLMALLLSVMPASASYGWLVDQKDNDLQIFYGHVSWPIQCASLDLNSSYFRLNWGPYSGWGTSVIILPAFWEESPNRGYHQSGQITEYSYTIDGTDLVINFIGIVSGLTTNGKITLFVPPDFDLFGNPYIWSSITAKVEVLSVEGDITLQPKPYEAFKPLMISSMHISDTYYDAKTAFTYERQFYASSLSKRNYTIPLDMWLLPRPVITRCFGTEGGYTQWQIDNNQGSAPTITIVLDRYFPVQGWVTYTTDPNWDNIGFAPASEVVLRSWSYYITATRPSVRIDGARIPYHNGPTYPRLRTSIR